MRILRNQNGFSYILALSITMIMGIMLGMVGQSWRTIKQRDMEEELLFRGDQIAEVLYQELLCKNAANAQLVAGPPLYQVMWPVNSVSGTILEELVSGKKEKCMNGKEKIFRLRASALLDPITGKPWQLLKPIGDSVHFLGVASTSTEEPFRKKFTELYDSNLLDDKMQYVDWTFTWELKQPSQLLAVPKK